MKVINFTKANFQQRSETSQLKINQLCTWGLKEKSLKKLRSLLRQFGNFKFVGQLRIRAIIYVSTFRDVFVRDLE